jgi:hypothetical protein
MSYTADQIEEIVKNILTDMLENVLTKEKLDEKYLEFRTKNRMFYETILTGGFDPVIFNEMMKSKRKLESGVDQYSVDTKFGQFMADKYIAPALKKADQK